MTLDAAAISRGTWAIVDSGLATVYELEHVWTLDDYMEACEYLELKAKAQAKATADIQARSRAGAQL